MNSSTAFPCCTSFLRCSGHLLYCFSRLSLQIINRGAVTVHFSFASPPTNLERDITIALSGTRDPGARNQSGAIAASTKLPGCPEMRIISISSDGNSWELFVKDAVHLSCTCCPPGQPLNWSQPSLKYFSSSGTSWVFRVMAAEFPLLQLFRRNPETETLHMH